VSAAYLCPPPAPPPHAARVRADAPAQRRVRETEAARTVRSWGIASMLREVGHLLSLAEFEDKLANAISTKYSSRDLSPSSKRTAGCWSGLVRIVWVCHQRASALRDELLSPRPLFRSPLAVDKDYVQYVEAFKCDTRGAGGEVGVGGGCNWVV
jgi:hypothetical protein